MDKLMLVIALCVAAYWFFRDAPERDEPECTQCFADIEPIPGGLGNYRSAQLSTAEIDTILSCLKFRTVIRLNGNGRDADGVTLAEEEALVWANGPNFRYINIEQKGALDTIEAELRQGGVWIHCRHGYDRTGAAVGYHLRWLGFSKQAIIEHNNWEGYVERKGSAYLKYWWMALMVNEKRRIEQLRD